MGMLDAVLGQLAGQDLSGLAGKVGLTPEQVESALHGLTRAAPEPGDTAGLAAAKTGLPVGALQQILAQVGGEGRMSQIAGALGSGGGLGGLAGMFGGGAGREGN